jgi:transposase
MAEARTSLNRETTIEQRQQMVRWHAQGSSYAVIASHLGCSRWTVGRWVRAAARGGEAALGSRSHRPRTPHPQTTPVVVQTQIQAIRQAHPHWGARLIRRQLELDGVPQPPSEVTIHAWLRRWDVPLVRPPRHKPLGWTSPAPASTTPLWQLDFKQKGGHGT